MKKIEMSDLLEGNVLDYARYTITDRAIPNVSDGLKNIHRRIIWSLYLDKLTHDRNRTKSVNAVGGVLRYSPHGDSSVYDACVRLANDSVVYQLIDGKGAFSSITSRDVVAGASRYTEMRLSEIASELLQNIDKNTIDMVNNFDDTRPEPTDLPATFPLILCNPNKGIAVGLATNIPPFNLSDVIDNTVNMLKGKNTFSMFPDFPTGGYIVRDEDIVSQVKNIGIGSFSLRAKHYIEDSSIYVTEIPYTTTREAIIESIVKLVKENKISGIVDVNDNTGVNGLEIEIEFKNRIDGQVLMERLFKLTPLESKFKTNLTVLVDNKPKTLGYDSIIMEWIKFRANSIKRGASFDINKKTEKRHLLLALKQVLSDIDKAVSIIRETNKDNQVIANLIHEFSIDEKQAEYVSDIKLRNLNKEYLIKRVNEIDKLESEVRDLKDIVENKETLTNLIINQLSDIKEKYGQERKTTITNIEDFPKIDTEEFSVEDYNIKIFITKEGYIKKIPLTSLRGASNIKIKDGDCIVNEVETTNNSDILIFTDQYNVYKYKSHELEDHKPSVLGEYLPTLLELKDENISYVTATNDYSEFLLIGFQDGKMAKINLSAYETKQNRLMLKNAYANKKVLYWNMVKGDINIIAISSTNKVVGINTEIISSKTGKTVQGNQIIKPKEDSHVKAFYTINSDACPEFEYYKVASAGVGKYLRKEDFLDIIDNS